MFVLIMMMMHDFLCDITCLSSLFIMPLTNKVFNNTRTIFIAYLRQSHVREFTWVI